MKPIQRSTLRHQVREAVLERVVSGQFAPSERINETTLARELGVSATPVREALLSLEGQRFLRATPGKGFAVAPLDAAEVHDIYSVLAALDTMALRLCAPFDTERIGRLRQANERFRALQGETGAAIRADVQFHAELVSSCPNLYLLDLIRSGRQTAQRYEYAFLEQVMDTHASADQHEEILAALERSELDVAVDKLNANWNRMVEVLIPLLEPRDNLDAAPQA